LYAVTILPDTFVGPTRSTTAGLPTLTEPLSGTPAGNVKIIADLGRVTGVKTPVGRSGADSAAF